MLVGMTNDFFAPVDSVSKTDRDRAEQRLREAHQLGRIDAAELEARMSRVIAAERLDELAAATDGPLPSGATNAYAQPGPFAQPGPYAQSYDHTAYAEPGAAQGRTRPTFVGTVQQVGQGMSDRGTTMAVVAHLLPFVTWLFGPAVVWALSAKGSNTRREAAKAFNWQLIAFVIGIVVAALGWIIPGDGNPIAGIWTAIWVVLTVIGAVMAGKGAEWTNPIRRVVPLEVLNERGR